MDDCNEVWKVLVDLGHDIDGAIGDASAHITLNGGLEIPADLDKMQTAIRELTTAAIIQIYLSRGLTAP